MTRHSRSRLRTRLILGSLAVLLVTAWAAPAQAFNCRSGQSFAIRSIGNSKYVSAELGWSGSNYGILRARSRTVGPWERFGCQTYSDHHVSIFSQHTGLLVTAELSRSGSQHGILRTRTFTRGTWETFTMIERGSTNYPGLVTIASPAYRGRYVSAELGWTGLNYGTLRTRADSYGKWELFRIIWL